MMRRSESAGCRPLVLASITLRQTSAVASSRKSLAASRTVRAVSSRPPSFPPPAPLFFASPCLSPPSPPFLPKPSTAALPNAGTPLPNVIALMLVIPHSWRGECCPQRRRRIHHLAILAGLVERQNASRRLDVETAVFVLQVFQILG